MNQELFTASFMAASDLDMRRVINLLVKKRINFAVLPNSGREGGIIATTETGVEILQENEIINER